MICKYCGKQIPDDSVFCFYCSKAVAPTTTTIKVRGGKERSSSSSGGRGCLGGLSLNIGKPVIIGVVVLLVLAVLAFVVMAVLGMEIPIAGNGLKNPASENSSHRGNNGLSGLFGGGSQSNEERPDKDAVNEEASLSESNPYWECYQNHSDYVLPDSDIRYYSYQEISHLSTEELTIANMEIGARYGGSFPDSDAQEYFEARDWYNAGGYSYEFNHYELSNLKLITVYLDMQSGDLYNSGNPYIDLYRYDDYVFPTSSSRNLKDSDLSGLSQDALCVARNEICARHGCIFEDYDMQTYFYSKSWYVPSVPEDEFNMNSLNSYESRNISFIDNYNPSTGYEVSDAYWSPDNPYKAIYESYGRSQVYFFSDSSSRLLTSTDIAGMNIDELCLARNEIWARNGYLFGDDHLREYFQHFSWYHPTTAMGDQDAVDFSSVEYDNIRFLRARQSALENGR